MSNLKFNILNITVPQGQTFGSAELQIDSGYVEKCALLTNDAPSEFINVKIEDIGGDELHPSVSYKEYQPTNGNHYDSRKSIDFKGNRKIKVTAYSDKAVAKDFKFQMVFYVDQTNN
ncbi:hypothetical protein [uncultured Tenacibaculum sp.]|uniref:hypothetical protein n=1 Tax=uncultured Tenacibaculum sp. TaxID=174713 RepID=UPI002632B933|nr:hypothetical protein [uncultured Tenacibaculum sp.]